MPITSGFNHVATLTTDMERTVEFYRQAFEAEVTFEMAKTDDHPRMVILDLGSGAASERLRGRGRRDHRRSPQAGWSWRHRSLRRSPSTRKSTLEHVRERLVTAGADEVGEIQQLGDEWSLFFRDPDGMELEVCCSAD